MMVVRVIVRLPRRALRADEVCRRDRLATAWRQRMPCTPARDRQQRPMISGMLSSLT